MMSLGKQIDLGGRMSVSDAVRGWWWWLDGEVRPPPDGRHDRCWLKAACP